MGERGVSAIHLYLLSREYFSRLSINERLRAMSRACCSNPNPQVMYDKSRKTIVLQCMNCSAFQKTMKKVK
jgi:hypothetical protein